MGMVRASRRIAVDPRVLIRIRHLVEHADHRDHRRGVDVDRDLTDRFDYDHDNPGDDLHIVEHHDVDLNEHIDLNDVDLNDVDLASAGDHRGASDRPVRTRSRHHRVSPR
jgi:hypothetical protein